MLGLWFAPNDPSTSDILAVVAIVCVFASQRFGQRPLKVFYWLAYAFLLANLISMLAAHSPGHANFNLATMVFLFCTLLIYPTIAANLTANHITKIYTAIIASATMAGVLGVLANLRLLPGPVDWYFAGENGIRISPFFQDPNVYSPFLCFGFALVLTYFWDKKKIPIAFALLAPIMLSILLSFSRAGWLNLAVTGFMFLSLTLFVQGDRLAKNRFIILAAAAFSIIIIAFPVMVEVFGVGETLQMRMQIQHYDSERFAAQELAYNVSLENPLGIGPGHFTGRHHFPQSDFLVDPHNIYLKILVERGWLGFASFFGIIGYCFFVGLHAIKRNPMRAQYSIALLSALTGIMVNGLFISAIHWRHLYIVIGLILAEYVLAKIKQRNEFVSRN
jgi:O-antigen ligase